MRPVEGKVVWLNATPIARVVSLLYGALGILAYVTFAFTESDQLILPFGVFAPLVSLGVNLNLARSNSVFYNIGLLLLSTIAYLFTGYVTGLALVASFNFIAKRRGGVSARVVLLMPKEDLDSAVKSNA